MEESYQLDNLKEMELERSIVDMTDIQRLQGPEHQRIPSVSHAVHGVMKRARLYSDEEYISLLNSNAFDFKASPLVFTAIAL